MSKLDCEVVSHNHSKDITIVYDGAESPLTMCGFHGSTVSSQTIRQLLTQWQPEDEVITTFRSLVSARNESFELGKRWERERIIAIINEHCDASLEQLISLIEAADICDDCDGDCRVCEGNDD